MGDLDIILSQQIFFNVTFITIIYIYINTLTLLVTYFKRYQIDLYINPNGNMIVFPYYIGVINKYGVLALHEYCRGGYLFVVTIIHN